MATFEAEYDGAPIEVTLKLPNQIEERVGISHLFDKTVKRCKMELIQEYYPQDRFGNSVNPNDHQLVLHFLNPVEPNEILCDQELLKHYKPKLERCSKVLLQCIGTEQPKPVTDPFGPGLKRK